MNPNVLRVPEVKQQRVKLGRCTAVKGITLCPTPRQSTGPDGDPDVLAWLRSCNTRRRRTQPIKCTRAWPNRTIIDANRARAARYSCDSSPGNEVQRALHR